jgi:hypothetical protein
MRGAVGIPFPSAAVLDPVPELREYRQADADPIAAHDGLPGPWIDAAAPGAIIHGDAGGAPYANHDSGSRDNRGQLLSKLPKLCTLEHAC